MGKVKGLRNVSGQLRNGHEDVKSRTGNGVGNTVVTVQGARWVPDLSRQPLG